jgi:phosphatidylserine/phosphatidylglycerophosphate/cardiolipin synthase-like enzyme
MVNYKIVLSNPGDYTATFFQKLKKKIFDINNEHDISFDDILMLDKVIMHLFTNTKRSIDIMAPFQTNIDGKILSQIIKLEEDGIDIRILTRYCFEKEKCFDRNTIADYVRHFDHLEETKKKGSLHAKVIIRDKSEVYFGSGELMESSLNQNLEIGMLTDDSKIVRIICNVFDSAWELAS